MPKAKQPKLTRLELEIMQPLWRLREASVRQVLEALPEDRRPEYTTVQTVIYRLEEKGVVRRTKKIGNAHIFAPIIERKSAIGGLVEDLIELIGGSPQPVMSHLVESGKIGLKELRELEKLLEQGNRGDGQ